MLFDRRLICKCNGGEFSASWLAATIPTVFRKEYSHQEIDSIDVPYTCNKLCLAITQPNNAAESENREISTPGEDLLHIPFRAASSLCYGTLRIFEQQVNNLYNECAELNQITNAGVIIEKRKSITSLSVPNRKESRFENSDLPPYTDLLLEAEDLVQWSRCEQSFIKSFLEQSIVVDGSSKKCITQMREITIREITTEMVIADDEIDHNFGVATLEDIQEIFHFSSGLRRTSVHVDNSLKRKIPLEERLGKIKRSKQDNCLDDRPPSSLSDYDVLTPSRDSVRLSISNSFNEETNEPDNELISDVENVVDFSQNDRNDSPEDFDIVANCEQRNIAPPRKKKRNNNLIEIDQRVIESRSNQSMDKIRSNIERLRLNQNRFAEVRKFPSAKDLLETHPPRVAKFRKNIKRQFRADKDAASVEYINILNSIFDCSVSKELASEIYPDWDRDNKNKSKKKAGNNLTLKTQRQAQNQSENENVNSDYNNNFCDGNYATENGDVLEEFLPPLAIPESRPDCSEWSPEDVKIKLIDFWLSNGRNEIDAHSFLSSAGNRFNAAIAFHSLLTLAKNKLIKISTEANSVQMSTIILDPGAMKELIDKQSDH